MCFIVSAGQGDRCAGPDVSGHPDLRGAGLHHDVGPVQLPAVHHHLHHPGPLTQRPQLRRPPVPGHSLAQFCSHPHPSIHHTAGASKMNFPNTILEKQHFLFKNSFKERDLKYKLVT